MRQHYLRSAAGYRINQSTDDQYIANTELLLKGEGSDGQTNNTFVDSSTSSHTITRNGDTTQGSFSPFSPKGWSGYFDGSNDSLVVSPGSDFDFGTGDFTVETWYYCNALNTSSYSMIIDARDTSPYNVGTFAISQNDNTSNSNKLNFTLWPPSGGGSATIYSLNSIQVGQWYHIALCRGNGTLKAFVNGVEQGSVSNNYNINSGHPYVHIGSRLHWSGAPNGSNFLNGYLSNFRVIKGTGLYTTTFTPPTEPLTAVTNTTLLTLQDNRFIDNSSSNHTITANGDVTIKPTSPFSGNREYPKASYFSGEFDGSNDYLSIDPGSSAYFSFPSGGFTTSSLSGFSHGQGSTSSGNNSPGPVSGYYRLTTNTPYSGAYIVDNTARQYDKDWSITFKMEPQGNYFPDGFCVAFNTNSTTIGTRGTMVPPTNGGVLVYIQVINWFGPQPPYQTLRMFEETSGTRTQIGYAASTTGTYAGSSTAGFFGGSQYWWWDYEHSTGTHKIYHSSSTTKPSSPRVTATYTMPSTALHAYIGGGTGGASTEWRLSEWAVTPTSPTANDFAFGSNSFTCESWIYLTDTPTAYQGFYHAVIASRDESNTQRSWVFKLTGNATTWTGLEFTGFADNTNYQSVTATHTFNLNSWHHIAVVKSNTTLRFYVDGQDVGGTTNFTYTISNVNSNLTIGGYASYWSNLGYGYSFKGYLSNLRINNGTALYTTTFTPPTAPLTPVSNTKLLTLQDNYLVDHSSSSHSITNNGGVTLEPESPFSNSTYPLSGTFYSGLFDGSNDYLSLGSNSDFAFGTGDFTIEWWFYSLGSQVDFAGFVSCGSGTGSYQCCLGYASGGTKDKLSIYDISSSSALEDSATIQHNVWTHVAVTRSGNTSRLFKNGVLVDSVTDTSPADLTDTGTQLIGVNRGLNAKFNGYISNVRLVKGTALYTTDFTVPSEPLTAVSGTTLLTLQDATIQDNSASSHSITNNGATVTEIAPFGSALIDRAGSMYFDGNGDYLRCDAALDSFTAANDPFTIEAWFYCNSVDSSVIESIFGVNYNNGQSNNLMVSVLNVSGTPNIWLHYLLSGSNQIDAAQGAFSLHTWNHIAASYDGTTFRLYLNGSQLYSTTGTPSNSFDGCAFCVGAELDATNVAGNYFDGYITDVRIVKSALYTLNFTPPTAPLQPITNTKLLLSGNNGGVEDSLGKVNLFTNGPAPEINTTTKKFGTGSIKFDGSNDYLLVKHDPGFNIESGDFTIEGWYYRVGTGRHSIINKRPSSGNSGFELRIEPSSVNNNPVFYFTNGSSFGTINYSMPSNQWVYIAVVRSGSNAALFIDGQRKASSSSWTNGTSNTQSIWMGHSAHNSSDYLNGYLDDFRFTKGVARYDPTQTSHAVPTKTHPTI